MHRTNTCSRNECVYVCMQVIDFEKIEQNDDKNISAYLSMYVYPSLCMCVCACEIVKISFGNELRHFVFSAGICNKQGKRALTCFCFIFFFSCELLKL